VNTANAGTRDILDRLVECATRGLQVELLLRDGQKIRNFRVHEVIAPQGAVTASGEARVRGIVWPEHGARRDEYVQVRDIASVRPETGTSNLGTEEFFERHPLPLHWVRLARCPTGHKS